MASLWRDLVYAIRRLRKDPQLVIVVTIVLGLGIGANTTIFSILKGVVLPDLPVHDQNTLALLWSTNPEQGVEASRISLGDFADLRASVRSFQALAALANASANFAGGSEAVRLNVARATTNLFSVLGVQPARGRPFMEEDSPGNPPVVVLAHRTWQTYFAGDAGIVGREVEIDGVAHTVIGVMPPEFWFVSRETAAWLPMADPLRQDRRDERTLIVVGRLAPSASLAGADSEMTLVAARMATEHPETNKNWRITVTGPIAIRSQEWITIGLLFGVMALVLAIACTNIASLLLARTVSRRRETAVRMAIGAGRLRIVRQLLAESFVYASLGAAFAIWIGIWATDFIRRQTTAPFLQGAAVDYQVLLFTAGVSVLAALLFGLTPALQASTGNLAGILREGMRSAGGRNSERLRVTLMVGEVAVAAFLLIAAGLLLRTVANYRSFNLGFRTDHVLTLRLETPAYRHGEIGSAVRAHDAFLQEIRQLPDVVIAGAGTRIVPMSGPSDPRRRLTIADRLTAGDADTGGYWAVDQAVTPGYFEALDVPLLRGRLFSSADVASATPVALINRLLAERYWPGGDPVGEKISLDGEGSEKHWVTIVGVVGDIRAGPLTNPYLFLPVSQHPVRELAYVIRTRSEPADAAGPLQSAIRKVDSTQPVWAVKTMRAAIDETLASTYVIVGLIVIFGVVAVALAAFGIFGVFSHAVSERRGEMGIRLALGAIPTQLVRAIVARGLRLCALGIGLGVAAGFALSTAIRSLLFNVSTADPVTFGTTITFLFAVTALACYLPARRASRIDPVTSLRYE